LHSLTDIYLVLRKSKRWTRRATRKGQKTCPYIILVEKRDGNRSLWRREGRWEDNIKWVSKSGT
jgi:hypothetical protein